ncbi:MAG: hypothetical protein GX326_06950 [Clostridiaceae bacterium]|nr:hypothetical protein [Clostridiaceae bacterium]
MRTVAVNHKFARKYGKNNYASYGLLIHISFWLMFFFIIAPLEIYFKENNLLGLQSFDNILPALAIGNVVLLIFLFVLRLKTRTKSISQANLLQEVKNSNLDNFLVFSTNDNILQWSFFQYPDKISDSISYQIE